MQLLDAEVTVLVKMAACLSPLPACHLEEAHLSLLMPSLPECHPWQPPLHLSHLPMT